MENASEYEKVQEKSGYGRFIPYTYALLTWIFLLCITFQVFLAGLATFVDPLNWARHASFVHLFEFILVLLFILSFLRRFPLSLRLWPVGLFILVGLQYMTAEGAGPPWVAALHPVNALFIFWCAIVAAKKAARFAFHRLK